MSSSKARPTPGTRPTQDQEINDVLADFVEGVTNLLGDNLVGAYLQGSMAVGDHNDHSDIDFIVVVREDVDDSMVPALNALHESISRQPSYWAKHLEGSYAPAAAIRRWSLTPHEPPGRPPRPDTWIDPETGMPPRRYPFWFLPNGGTRLVRSEHDNTRVVRWSTREKGSALIGPAPAQVIDEVTADDLRAEMIDDMPRYAAPFLSGRAEIEKVWMQSFFVVLYCRMLHTLAIGEVASKKAGAEWARGHLDPRWRGLIDRAEATWQGPQSVWHDPADPDEATATVEFVRYAVELGRAAHATSEHREGAGDHG